MRVCLAGIEFVLASAEAPLRFESDDAYRSFVVAHGDSISEEPGRIVRVRHSVSASPAFEGDAIFESEATWSILARGSERAVAYRHPDGETLFVAVFRPGSSEVTVLCAPRLQRRDGAEVVLDSPFRYPLDQVLTMYMLGGEGIVLHAAGALVNGRGLAFAGVSGAGKSTLTALASGRPGWTSLSDDRVILRTGGQEPTLHGTPWPGEGRSAENRQGRLEALFFLEQGRDNEIRRMATKDALARLLRTTSVPWYDAEYLGGVLSACGELVAGVPTAVLTFRPEIGAVEAVERVLAQANGSSGTIV